MKTEALAPWLGLLAIIAVWPCAAQPTSDGTTAPDPMSAFYGATLRIEVKGYHAQRFFEPDHTYRDRIGSHVVVGAWTVEGDKICTQGSGAGRYCNQGVGKTIGETWIDHDPYTGNPVTFSLVAGRPGSH